MNHLLLLNGKVRTLDDDGTVAEAMAIRDGLIEAVGSTDRVAGFKTARSEVIDLNGKTVLPGFIDAHNHMIYYGTGLLGIDCQAASIRTIGHITDAIAQKASLSPPGSWIRGYGYDDALLAEGRHPTRRDLDPVSPDHPVVLYRTCGHMLVANSRALELAGIGEQTPDPAGGEIHRDAGTARPSGLIKEYAQELIKEVIVPFSNAELVQALEVAGRQYLSEGITSVQEAGVGYFQAVTDEMRAFQEAQRQGRLKQRVSLYLLQAVLPQLEKLGLQKGFGDAMLRIAGVKFFADGVPSAHTAAVYDPYPGVPDTTGILCWQAEEFVDIIARIHACGLQSSIHAMGDRAIDVLLDAYETVLNRSPRPDHRHRIEHFTLVKPAVIERARKLGIVPVVAATELPFYGDAFTKNLGPERARWCYPLRSILDGGLPVALSSDRPFDPVGNPLFSIQAAVERTTRSGRPFVPEQCIRVEEALRMHTRHAAHAAFEEECKGTIEAGKVGDVAVLAADPLETPVADLSQIPVAYTIVGGDVVYSMD